MQASARRCLKVGFDAGDELASPASEEFRGFVGGDVNDQGVQQLFGAVAGEPDEGLVDPGGAVVVDVPGLPGVPGVGGFCFESAGDADGAGDAVFVGFDGEADFQGGEFAGLVAGVGAVVAEVGDAGVVQGPSGVAELQHQCGVFGLGGGEHLLLVDDLVDQFFGVVGGCPHAIYCSCGVRQSLLMWITLPNTCLSYESAGPVDGTSERHGPARPRRRAEPLHPRTILTVPLVWPPKRLAPRILHISTG